MKENGLVVSVDIDGVLVSRFPAQRSAFSFRRDNSAFVSSRKVPITKDDRGFIDSPLSAKGKFNVIRHGIMPVRQAYAELIRNISANLKVVNTGRSNHQTMVEATMRQLHRNDMDNVFDDFFFKPKGVDSIESKYWALKELQDMGYENIVHIDDNAHDVRRLAIARDMDSVRFIIAQDLTTGRLLSRKEMKEFPNIAIIAVRRDRTVVTTMPQGFLTFPHQN